MTFVFFGCKVHVSVVMMGVITLAFIVDTSGVSAWALAFSAMHECGHIFAMAFLDKHPSNVSLGLYGLKIVTNEGIRRRYWQDTVIALAGPFVNIALAVMMMVCDFIFHIEELRIPSAVNFAIGAFNLLPIDPLDGGRALYALLCTPFGQNRAEKMVRVVSFCTIIPIAAFGFFILFRSRYNFTLLLTSLYLTGMLLFK